MICRLLAMLTSPILVAWAFIIVAITQTGQIGARLRVAQ